MLKNSQIKAALALGAALCLAAGCKPPPPPANPSLPSGPKTTQGGTPADTPAGQDMADTAPVAEEVTHAITQHASLFPKGVTLESVTVRGGVAALNFSPEFHQLANMGDTTESRAQKQLRAALAKFPAIQTMTVTVKGKPFDSQATDWSTPFPVRLSAEEREAAAAQDALPDGTAGRKEGGRQ